MNATTRSAVERTAGEVLQERIEVEHDTVARALAREIVDEHIDVSVSDEALQAGIEAALDEIDDDAFGSVVDVIRDSVAAEVEHQAKEIAVRMLREMAAQAQGDAARAVQ